MKIGLVLPSVPGYSETFFRSKIKGLQKAGFEVILFVKSPKGSRDFICPVVVHPMLKKVLPLRLVQSIKIFVTMLMRAPKVTARMVKIERSQGKSLFQALQSVVVASSILPYQLDWLHFGFTTAAIQRENIAKAIGAKLAVSFRGYDINQVPILQPNAYDQLWPHVDKVHSISSYLVRKANTIGLPQNIDFQKITPAIDVNKFVFSTEQKKPKSILLVSRLHWIKGIEYVLHAASLLKQQGEDVKIHVVGDGAEFERLTFASYQLGLSDDVVFHGKCHHEEVSSMMQKHEIFIQYSYEEGFCNAVLEAQASGMLCVVSDAEGLQENVLHEKTGWVVPKRNPEALAKKLQEVLDLPETEKENVRKIARQRIESEFSIEKQQREFVEFYQH